MENTQNETFGMDPMHFKNIMGLVNDLISNANQNDSENGFFQKFQKTYYTTLFHFVNCSTVTQLNQGTTPNTFKMGYFYIINYLNCRFDYVNNIMRGEEVFEYIKCILITIQNYRNISLTVQGLSEEDFRKMNQFVLKEEAQIIQPGEISATHENTIVRIFFDFLLKKKVINQILLFGNNKNLNCYWQIYFLYFIKDYFSVFNLENAMNNKVIQEVFNSYANASLLVYNTITSNPESIKDNKKEELDTILKYMTEINKFMFMLFHGNTNKEVHVIIKKEIEIADVILKFPQLNSKVIALKFLNELCKEGLNANQTQIQLPPQNPPQGPIGPNENLFTRMANCMNPNNSNKENNEYLPKKMELLYDYFTQQIKIMDVIFGENMHEALIQNSYFILKYLYIKRIIGSEQISNLWNLSLNKHIFKAQIFMALNNLAPYLNEADSNFLLKSIADSEYNSINEVTISILTGLAPSLKLAEQKEKVIEIFFKFSNENALRFGMSPQTASVIRNSMIEVLLQPEYWYYLKKYIKKSIYCIGCNNMPKTYLEFLKTTLKKIKEKSDIELYKAFHPSVNDFRSLINFFDRKYSLINIILYNILDIKKEVVYYAENIAKYQNFLQIHQGNEINQPLEDFFNFKELFEGFDHKIELEKDEWIHGLEAEQNRQQQPNNFGNIFNENQSFHSDSSNQFINPNNPQQNNPLVNISGNANANPNVTLSTDKSLDNEGDIITNADNDLDQDIATDYNEEDFHSIWSDIDNIEESRKFFIRNFMKDFKADLSPPNILSGNNLYLVLKNLKMNYYNQNCYDLIKDIIEFISELILKGGILIKKNIIIYLYDVLVKNAIYNDDIEIFFGFFNDIVKQQIKINQTFISDELLSYLIFEVCLVTDCRYNYISCYELIRTFFIYFNWRHNNLEYMSNSDTVSKINNFSVLVCFDSIWECYLLSVNKELEKKAFAFIMNILMVASKNNSENIQKISQKIFNDISEYGQPPNSQRNSQQQGFNINQQDVNMDQSNIKSENEGYILKLLNLFSEYLKLIKAQSGNGASDYQVIQNGEGFNPVMDKGHSQKISIYFINNYYTNNETQKNHIKVNKNGTVNKLRDTIIKEIATLKANDATLDEIQREEKKKEIIGELNRTGVMLFYKGQILKDGQSLNQLNMEDNATIMVSKDSKDEQMDVDTAPDPASNVKEAVKGLKEIWSGMSDDFLEAALKMNNYDQEKTAIDLTKDEFLVKVKQFQENEFANLVNNLEDNDNKSQTVETDIVDDFQPKGENNNAGNNNGPNNNTAPINNGSNNNPNINQANAQTQTNIINPNENQNFQNQGAPMPFDPNAQQKQDDFPHTYQPNKPEDDFPHTYQPNIENTNQQNVPQNNSNNNQQNNQQNVPQNNSNNNPPNQQNNQQNVPQNNLPNQQNNQQNPQPNGAENRPEIILIDESKLSTLLNLLDIYDNRNISDSVWSIIGIIDIPKNLIESIYKMDINTANLISNKGLLMLNLRIILSCIYGVEDPSMELNKSAKAFNFIQEGGEPFDKVCWTEAFISQKLPQKFLIDALIQLIGEQSFNSMSILIIRNILFLLEQFLLKTIQLCLKDGRPPSKYYDEVLKQITEENKKNKKLLDFEFKKMTALNSLLDMLEESHLIRIIFNYLEMNSQIEKNNEGNMNQNNPCAIYHSPIVNEDLFNISMDIMQLLLCIRDFKSEFAEAELKQSVLIKYLFHPIQGIRQRTKELFMSIDKHLFTFKIKDSVILNENEVKQIHEKWQQERQNQHSNQVEAGNNFICGYTVLDFLVKLTKNMSDLFFFKKGRNGEFLSLFYLLLKNYSEKINNDRIINLGPMIDNIINKILVPLQCEEIKTELGQENLAELLTFFSDIIKMGKEPLVYTILEEAFKKNGILLISALYSSLFILNNNNSGGNNFSNNSKPIISNFAYTNSKLRQSSYNLILTLTDYDDDYKTFFYSKIMSHHLEFNTSKSLREDIDIPIKKDSEDYVGLQNFGATCYLNSLFQQLFMNTQFFGSIFEFNIPPEKRHTSIIYQMQRAFMSLKLSIKKYYPLRKFIHSIPKAFNSEPINVHIQQDSDEFLSILLDLLEKEAKEFGKENFLEESFKGKISNEIVSMEKDFPYYSTTEEDFYRITVDIKNHRSLEEALDFFVKGEVLDGDNQIYVEKYKKKIPVRKRSTLKKMSNNLIVQLKRFELDYTTFTNYKLNDYISFPKKICFKKYTRAFINNQEQLISGQRQSEVKLEDYETDNLSDEKTTYILTGILIHSGSTLQSGHYYSFIMDQMKGHWRRFDDVSVRNFEESQIEKECFGDEKIGQNSNVNALGSGINGQSTSYQRCQNAYLLFYTREDRFNANRSISDDSLWSYMNGQKGELVTDVIKENSEYVIMKNYIQDEYIDFILNFWRKVKGNHSQINQPNYKFFSKEKKKEFEIGKVLFNYLFKNQGLKKENLPLTINPQNAAEMYKKCKDEVEDSLAAINSNNNLSKSRNHQEVQYEDYRTIKFLFRFFYSIVLTFVPKKVPLVAKLLTAEIKKYYSIASWFLRKLEKNPNELFINYIFNSEVMDIRTELSNLVLESIKYCAKKDKEIGAFYLETPYAEYDERNQAIIGKLYQQGLSLRFIETVLYENFKRIYTTYPKNKEYLDLLVNIITNLPESVKITKDYFKYIINYICNNSYGDVAKEFPNLRVVPPNRNIYFDSMPAISLLSIFVQGCLTPGIKQSRQLAPGCIMIPRQSEEYYTKLPKDWENILIKEFLIDSVLNISLSPYVIVDFEENKKRMGYQFTPQMKLLSHICFEDNDTSIKVIETILKAIGDFDHNNLRVIYNSLFSLSAVMELNDNVRETRYLALFNLFENKDVFGGIPLFDFLCTSEGNEASALIILYTLGVILNRNIEIMHFMNSRINDFSSFPILWERLTSQEMKETLINNLTTLGLDLNDVLAECYEVYINQLKLNQIQRGDFNLF